MSDSASGFKWVGTRPVRPDGLDKVTGRASFGADFTMPGMLVGRILRSPHAHARIIGIDASAALAVPGVKAVVTSADFPDIPDGELMVGEGPMNFRDLSWNVMARGKALYDGHAVAAVAATSRAAAEEAVDRIRVDYEVLPHVVDVLEAMEPDAPLLHEDLFTQGVDPTPERPSNVASRCEFSLGSLDAGFAAADVVVEGEYITEAVHQGYIEPHAAVASVGEDGQCTIWCSSQGQFMVRAYCAKLLGMENSQIRVIPSEIGGGFGGKTTIYVEPVALALSRKAGRPVKIVMDRDEVFRATGPTSSAHVKVRIGATKDGRLTAGDAELRFQAGAFSGSHVQLGCMCGFAPYDIDNVRTVGYDVVVNRPKCAAYRAPGAPMAAFGVESALDELAEKLGMGPLELRLANAAREGTKAAYGPKFREIGYAETVEAGLAHEHYRAKLGPNQGRGVASGFWFNIGGQTSAAVHINEDGTAVVVDPNPDIGGSRASMAIMAAEALGIDYDRVRPIVPDTSSIPYSDMTGGSRVTFSVGMAVVEAAQKVVEELRSRAAQIWEVDPDGVVWENGEARPASRQRRRLRAPHPRRLGRKLGEDRRSHLGAGDDQRAWGGTRIRHPPVRCGGRSGNGRSYRASLHRNSGRGPGDSPELRRRAAPGRRRAGDRLGAQRGVRLQQGGHAREPGLPRLPGAGRVGPSDDRHGPRRGPEPASSLRGAGGRGGADRASARGGRERDLPRVRDPHESPARIPAPAARGP